MTTNETTVNGSTDTSTDLATQSERNVAKLLEAKRVRDEGIAEADAFFDLIEAAAEAGRNLKPIALQEVARKLGMSANKFGRTETQKFVGWCLATTGQNLSVNARITLAQTANKACFSDSKPAFKVIAKAGAMDGSVSFKLNLPAQVEAAIN